MGQSAFNELIVNIFRAEAMGFVARSDEVADFRDERMIGDR